MPVVTIGEYEEAADKQRTLLREQVVDLSEGEGVSQPFQERTRSVRVCGDVAHCWSLGKAVTAEGSAQRRPADASERLDVAPGQCWAFAAKVTGESGASGERGLALILEVLNNKAKLEKALAEFSERRTAAEKAEKGLKAARKELAAGEAALAEDRKALEALAGDVASREAGLDGREASVAKQEAALKESLERGAKTQRDRAAAFAQREAALKPQEAALAKREAALAKQEAQAKADAERAAKIRAELEQKMALLRA